jgi:uncharacterized protein (UPF0335 family)
LAECRAERSAIQQRLASGYRKHVEAGGGKVGRIRRVKMENAQLLKKHKEIVKYLKGRVFRTTMVGKVLGQFKS